MDLHHGKLAVYIVTVAILGSIALGYFGSMKTVETTYNDWNEITDTAGLYSFETVPTYAEYNPVENYTGWSNVTFTQNATSNRYLVEGAVDSTTEYTLGITANETYANDDDHDTTLYDRTWTYHYDYVMGSGDTVGFSGSSAISVVNLADMLTDVTEDATIDFGDYNGLLVPSFSPVTKESKREYKDLLNLVTVYTKIYYDTTLTSGEPYVETATYDYVTTSVTAYAYNGAELWTANARDCWFVYGGSATTSYTQTVENPVATVSHHANPTYMDVRDGVTVSDGDKAEWLNGQTNGRVSVLVSANGTGTLTLADTVNSATTGGLSIMDGISVKGQSDYRGTSTETNAYTLATLVRSSDGAWTVSNANGSYNVGVWTALLVSVDEREDTVTVTPVKTLTDYQTYETVDTSYTLALSNHANISSVKGLFATASGCDFTMSVTSTMMEIGTNDSIMANPTITVGSLFPELRDCFRLDLGSPAVVGSSLSFAGSSIAVEDGAYVYDGETHALGSLSFKVEDGNAYVRFNSDRTPTWIDLGAAQDTTLSMVGEWYFDTSVVYEPVVKTSVETVNDWGASLSWNGILLVAVGIVAVLSLVLYTRMEEPFGWWNGAIVVVFIALLIYMLV